MTPENVAVVVMITLMIGLVVYFACLLTVDIGDYRRLVRKLGR